MVGLYYSATILAGRASDPFVVPPCNRKRRKRRRQLRHPSLRTQPNHPPNNSSRNMEGHADYDTDNFSEGLLECTVDRPQKELDGTKDAYISYLVSTRVILTNI